MTDADRWTLREQVKQAEGFRPRAYQDSVGVWTIGFGTNLQELTIEKAQAEQWLVDDLTRSEAEIRKACPTFGALSSARQCVLVEMAYNLGLPRLLTFEKMLAALKVLDFEQAAFEMRNSQWAGQVGDRAERLIAAMLKG